MILVKTLVFGFMSGSLIGGQVLKEYVTPKDALDRGLLAVASATKNAKLTPIGQTYQEEVRIWIISDSVNGFIIGRHRSDVVHVFRVSGLGRALVVHKCLDLTEKQLGKLWADINRVVAFSKIERTESSRNAPVFDGFEVVVQVANMQQRYEIYYSNPLYYSFLPGAKKVIKLTELAASACRPKKNPGARFKKINKTFDRKR